MTEDGYPKTAEEILEALRDLLPHGSFKLKTGMLMATPFLTAVCPCGRAHPFLHGMDDDALVRWLVDHDDDMFLTAEQRAARDEATVDVLPPADGQPLLTIDG